jgi:hypothetical protein
LVGIGGDNATVVQHQLGAHQVVECQPGYPVEGAVAAAEGQARHADLTEIARCRYQPVPLGCVDRIGGGGSARDRRSQRSGGDVDPPHSRHVDE